VGIARIHGDKGGGGGGLKREMRMRSILDDGEESGKIFSTQN
jgi:hypothetical protein